MTLANAASAAETRVRARRSRAFHVFGLPPTVALSVVVLLLLICAAVAAPYLTPYDPTTTALADRMLPPSWAGGKPGHLLGTDGFGRDVFTRVLYGARVSLSLAGLVIVFGGVPGAIIGIIAGYFGGVVDVVLMRAVDIFQSLPTILVAIVLAVVLGPSFANLVIVISLLLWPNIARQIRGDALVVKGHDYLQYSEAIGIRPWRIMLRHFLPNVTPSLLVMTTLEVGAVILTESTLSFLGAGIPPPQPSWGVIVADGAALIASGWWIALFPGLAIVASVMIFNTLGDWLRDHLDPRLKQR